MRPRSSCPFTSHGWPCTSAPGSNPERHCSSTRPRAAPVRRPSSSTSMPARGSSPPRDRPRRRSSVSSSAPRWRSTTGTPTSSTPSSTPPTDEAFDTVSGQVTLQTFRCMAFNGRHILAGLASGIEHEDEGLVPRPVLFGNFSLVGVCHAYVDEPVVFKRATGFNFPAHRDGERLHAELLSLFAAGKVRAIVGQEVPFRELPAALDAMERR